MEYKYLQDLKNILKNVNHLKSELSKFDINVNEITSYILLEDNLKEIIINLVEDINSNSVSVNNLVELIEIIKNNKGVMINESN